MYGKQATFREVSLSSIEVTGWLRRALEDQRNGLTGHLDQLGYPFMTRGWACEHIPASSNREFRWWPYEQYAYWVDGMTRCAHLLKDHGLLARSQEQIGYVLDRQHDDGYLGPNHLKSFAGNDLWPHVIFMRALMAEHSATGSAAVAESLERFGHYLLNGITTQGGPGTDLYGLGGRNLLNLEHLLASACRIDNQEWVQRCRQLWECSSQPTELAQEVPSGHGVSVAELLKLPVLLFAATGEEQFLDQARVRFSRLEMHHLLADGIPSSCEHLAGRASNLVHESCVISDYTWTLGIMLSVTGEAAWADRIERAVFNAGFGAANAEFTAHQYYSGPNQVLADDLASHWNAHESWGEGARCRMAYRPLHSPECCTGNITRFLPNYCARMWQMDKDGGLVAALYGPSTVTARLGSDRREVTLVEETEYPFAGRLAFRIQSAEPVLFALHLRIPGWSDSPSLHLNHEPLTAALRPGTFHKIEREWRPGDCLELDLAPVLHLSRWPGNGRMLEHGPLILSMPIQAETQAIQLSHRTSPRFPAYLQRPAGRWSYGLDPELLQDIERLHVQTRNPTGAMLSTEEAPLRIRVPAVKLRGWDAALGRTPALPETIHREGEEEIDLVPMGCTTLRLSIFPDCDRSD